MQELNKDLLARTLIEFSEEHGRLPLTRDCKESDLLRGKSTYSRYFGTFTKALQYAGLVLTQEVKKEIAEIECKCCGCTFETKRKEATYCSITCSNKDRIKIKVPKTCVQCGKDHKRNSLFCSTTCKYTYTMQNQTIGDAIREGSEQNKYRGIRDKCSNFYKHVGRVSECQKCGYDLHVENCHIRDISDFDENETVWDCNKPANILFLCRNCHWEFDKGILLLQDIGR